MKFSLIIDSDNEGVQTQDDIIYMLEDVIRNIHNSRMAGKIIDINGNSVGKFCWLKDCGGKSGSF